MLVSFRKFGKYRIYTEINKLKITMNFTIQFKHCEFHYTFSLMCASVCECVCEFL